MVELDNIGGIRILGSDTQMFVLTIDGQQQTMSSNPLMV